MLKIDEDMWCGDDNFLREAATNYFENLFTDGPSPSSPFPFLGFFPSFSDVDVRLLNTNLNDDEIKDAFFPCHLLNHLGLMAYMLNSFREIGVLLVPRSVSWFMVSLTELR
ncbi:hypothetical protein V6N11_018589 [Hibiscus sabdariffa]|uniref:Uncharacterized protein n=2 Tax=Hibiscus sabdariffa TaxID=183260 RepID=A0ABR2BAU1_9ROSI